MATKAAARAAAPRSNGARKPVKRVAQQPTTTTRQTTGKSFSFTYGGLSYDMAEVGEFHWDEIGGGGVKITVIPPRDPAQAKQSNEALAKLGQTFVDNIKKANNGAKRQAS